MASAVSDKLGGGLHELQHDCGEQSLAHVGSLAADGVRLCVGVGVVSAVFFALSPSAKDRQVCDALAQTLLSTRDTIELQRTGILVRELNCDVRRRAGPVLYRELVTDPVDESFHRIISPTMRADGRLRIDGNSVTTQTPAFDG